MKKSLGAKLLLYPTPVLVVGTYDEKGKPNAMTAAWGGICCSDPPCIAISLRKATYTYGNLMSKKAFTISIPSEKHCREADYFGMASGKNEDKFAKTGLTPVRSSLVDAPYIEEFPINIACRVLHVIEIGLHTQFIGEVLDTKIDEAVGDKDFIEQIKPLIFAPGSGKYYGIGNHVGSAFSDGKAFTKG